jgi:hypothetical protein
MNCADERCSQVTFDMTAPIANITYLGYYLGSRVRPETPPFALRASLGLQGAPVASLNLLARICRKLPMFLTVRDR